MSKLKIGDKVIVLTGRDKSRTGKLVSFDKTKQRVIVEGVNMVRRHLRANPQKNQKGGIMEKEAFMAISNVALFNTEASKKDKVIYKVVDGKKLRHYRSTDKPIDN